MYHVLHFNGKLIGVTNGDVEGLSSVSVIDFDGQIPNLNKVTWDVDTLSWISTAKVHTRYDFMTKFTSAERIAIRNSSDDTVKDFINLIEISDKVDTTDTTVVDSVQYLVSVNLLTDVRATEILS